MPRFTCGARQAGDETDHRIANIARAGRQFLGAEVLNPCNLPDRFGRLRWDDVKPRLHPRKRRLDIEHPLEISALVEHCAHRVAAVQCAEDRTVGRIGWHHLAPLSVPSESFA